MYITRNYCRILITPEFLWQIFKKYSNIKFHQYSPSGFWIVSCSQLIEFRTNRRKDMTKLIVAFAIFRTRVKGRFTLQYSYLYTHYKQLEFKRKYFLMSIHSVHSRKKIGKVAPRNILVPFRITHTHTHTHTQTNEQTNTSFPWNLHSHISVDGLKI